MRLASPSIPRRIAAVTFLFALAGCESSPTAEEVTEMPNFEGAYSLSGTYDGRTGDSGISGTVTVVDQVDGTATVSVSLKIRDNGNTSFALNADDPYGGATSAPVVADLETDGSFRTSFAGSEVIVGLDGCCNYTFVLDGRLSGDVLSGRWSLTRDMPSSDAGSFGASR